jgi:NADP-dependent 3-hydroxy acid dehydrogenase YdfG
MKIEQRTVLITGADGGIGTALLAEFIKRNVKKVYATGLSMDKLEVLAVQYPGKVVPLLLDVTDEMAVKHIVGKCSDLDLLVNNAGVELKSSFIGENAAKKALFEMKVNYIGVLSLINELLPCLKKNAPSAIVNILSVGSNAVVKRLATYCASKTATHLVTEVIREELAADNISVTGVSPGYVDTAMSSDINYEKASPDALAKRICDGIENDEQNIFPDNMANAFYKKHPITTHYLQ